MGQNKSSKISKTPWSTKAAMEQVYDLKLWGGGNHKFYSGEGSHKGEIVHPYKEAVVSFLASFKNSITVCDLGCGDFNIGQQFVKYAKKYIAADIVSDLIIYNKENFTTNNLEFHCLDIALDELPNGDCAIIRQVLQHLSNAEVIKVVSKLSQYKYVILTEHLPNGDFVPNMDIISGQGIRIKKKSGVNLLEPPFNFKPLKTEELLSIDLGKSKGKIVTFLYQVK